MINKVILIGNLGKDPETRYFDGGGAVARFSLATNENYQDRNGEWQKRTEWHDVECWNKLAERAEKALRKGMMVYVEGKLKNDTWQDKEGNNRRKTIVNINILRILEKRDNAESMNSTPSVATVQEPQSNNGAGISTPNQDEGDDLPF